VQKVTRYLVLVRPDSRVRWTVRRDIISANATLSHVAQPVILENSNSG